MQQTFVAAFAVALASVVSTAALAAPYCDLTRAVFADQQGNEAVVQKVYECWGYFSSGDMTAPIASSCLSIKDANARIAELDKDKGFAKLIGTRIFVVQFGGKFHRWTENL